MNGEMIAIIGAAVALGVGMFGSTRWIHKDVEKVRTEMSKLDGRLSGEMKASERRLSGEMNKLEGRLRVEMKESEGRLETTIVGLRNEMRESDGRLETMVVGLRSEIRESEGRLRSEMREGEDQIKGEMKAGFEVIADRLTNVGDRLSKVEGVIEGMFWNARSLPLPPDTTREGAE